MVNLDQGLGDWAVINNRLPLNRKGLPIPCGEKAEYFKLDKRDTDSTAGSNNFLRLMDRLNVPCEKVSRQSYKTPDFVVTLNGRQVAVEVTDIDVGFYDSALEHALHEPFKEAENDEPLKSPSTYDRLRKKLKVKQAQFAESQFSEMPALLVLFNGCAFPYLNHFSVRDALYGFGSRVPILNEEGWQISSRQVFDFTQKVSEFDKFPALFGDVRHNVFSAIACLDNGADESDQISFMGAVSMRVYFNPLAFHPLSQSDFSETSCFWIDSHTKTYQTNHPSEWLLSTTTF